MPDLFDTYVQPRTESRPKIYAYSDNNFPGALKVGYTTRTMEERMKEHYPTKTPFVPYQVRYVDSAMYPEGGSFMDHDVHEVLKRKGFTNLGGEWYKCSVEDVKAAVVAVRNRTENVENRTETYSMRPEQQAAVDKTVAYYESVYAEGSDRTPKFLWNAKMRFGKTFASYQLAKRMGFKKVLILTFKPAVVSSWRDDLLRHVDFEGWQFISRPQKPGDPTTDEQYEKADKSRPIVCFGSFQDYLGVNKETGAPKAKNEWVHATNWDLVIFDEYHFGAWKENAKKLFEQDEDSFDEDLNDYNRGDAMDETWLPITTNYYLYLSGTPFRALNMGEFIEEQVYSWTYSDEQRAKGEWLGAEETNPYAALPRMVMMTYQMPESIERIARQGEFDEFDLNVFFKAEGDRENAHFIYEDYVQKWLDLIRGAFAETTTDDLKLGAEKPPMPFSDVRLMSVLTHTLWFLPGVAACHAMANLLAQRQNTFYHDFRVIDCAGKEAGIGVKPLETVRERMGDPLATKTITLSCGKLMTGVTVRPWTGIFMLTNLSSPETYFQAAFRVQSPWEITKDDGSKEIVKRDCYVFDFALNRALRQISDYSRSLDLSAKSPEVKVGEFIKFLPVLAYNGSVMLPVDAGAILDMTTSGTTATLLAKKWESALLVNVDNDTLERLLHNEEAMAALMKIEGFRSLNEDIVTIINKSKAVKKAKSEKGTLSKREKEELSEAEKEYKSKREEIKKKLIKFATRIPVFMYLTDYREESLRDVITQLEPGLFRKVTGLAVKDFELLCSLNLFNEGRMNDAVYQFRRYEDSSLAYTGINRHSKERVGLFSTVLTREDYDRMAGQLFDSMTAVPQKPEDIPEQFFGAIEIEDEEIVQTPVKKRGRKPKEDKNTNTTVTPKAAEPMFSSMKTELSKETVPPHKETAGPEIQSISNTPITIKPGEKTVSWANPVVASIITGRKKVDVDVSKIVVGAKVKHKAFGEGTIRKIEKDKPYIYVWFEMGIDKQFVIPMAFAEGFLTLL